jgi:hypothetical protein
VSESNEKDILDFVNNRIEEEYHDLETPCSSTTIKILAELFQVEIDDQVYISADALSGQHQYNPVCGLLNGSLMFMNLLGKNLYYEFEEIRDLCYNFSLEFRKHFGSENCSVLRPEGFKEDNPPHICEPLTNRSILFTIEFIAKAFKMEIVIKKM